jgi:hypothetical protein
MGKEHNREDQEIDLAAVGRGIRRSAGNVNRFLYRCIRFFLKNALWILLVLVLGGALGFFMDRSGERVYRNQIIASPNFGSVDYLYAKVGLLKSKIKERDTLFLKKIGISDPKSIIDIDISPIVDIFKFVSMGTEQNYRLLELMAQDGDMKKIIVDPTTSKNYPYHLISFSTKGMTTSEATTIPIMRYLNNSPFYQKVQRQYVENVQAKIKADDIIIAQIDNLLSGLAKEGDGKSQVYINQNTQLNDVIKTKDELLKEQGQYKLELIGQDRVIKDNNITLNVKDDSVSNGNLKLVMPLVFLLLYLLGYAFVSFYRAQSRKEKNRA